MNNEELKKLVTNEQYMNEKIIVKLTRYELWLIKEALQFSFESNSDYFPDPEDPDIHKQQNELYNTLSKVK